MKKFSVGAFLSVLSLLVLYVLGDAADWHRISTRNDLNLTGVHLCSEDNGYLVTSAGDFVRFSAPNNKWAIDSIARTIVLQDIFFFPNCLIGFAVGSKGSLLATKNGGRTWERKTLDSTWWLYDVGFIDSLNGFIAGTDLEEGKGLSGILLKTHDGGTSWDTASVPGGRQVKYMSISPDGTIAVSGVGKMFISRDRGKQWEQITLPIRKTVRAVSIYGNSGIMVGMGGFVAMTADGGRTWNPLDIFPNYMHLSDVLVLDDNRAYIVGAEGLILFTDDGGKNWVPELSGVTGELNRIVKVGYRIYACGLMGAITYTDLPPGP